MVSRATEFPEEETEVIAAFTEMVAVPLLCLPCFFKYSVALLLWICIHEVDATKCGHVIQKKVGDTVELPSCLPSEGVDFAAWEYGDTRIASTDMVETSDGDQFQGRVKINGQNFSLTVESLTLNDSGSFKFVSEVNGEQRITTIITLKVYESVTEKPVLKVSSTWHELNSSCTVLLECGSARHSEVTYSWTVGNHTFKGSRVHFTVIPPGGDTDVTCTVSNSVSVNNASQIVHCSNSTSTDISDEGLPPFWIYIAGAAGTVFLAIVVTVAVAVRKYNEKQAAVYENTVYADVTENFSAQDGRSNTLTNQASLYETINDINTADQAKTIYDEVQLNRMQASR
ncbi:signaling lymphocytic activation molecule [Myripristis murdjan]|uniref:signaling lymphocytic activation molecule n=1 Tax=Myripristis murdjan TaxID=586833 RepID=UPI001175F5A4|nr:signaling lymphocytic activation molecule-like [Myripristis murdjan]